MSENKTQTISLSQEDELQDHKEIEDILRHWCGPDVVVKQPSVIDSRSMPSKRFRKPLNR